MLLASFDWLDREAFVCVSRILCLLALADIRALLLQLRCVCGV